jgi:hypothetical protein
MRNNIEEFKRTLHEDGVEWNSLYEQGVKIKPYYFGIYKTVYKPGFETAEQCYSKRLQELINYLDKLKISNPKTNQHIDKIRVFHNAFNNTVDFNSEAFRNGCRDLMKPLRRLSRLRTYTVKNTVVRESLVSDGDRKVLAKYCYQLNPYNYSYPYLTHFYYVTDEGINTLLINDNRRKQVRRLDAIGELMDYISELEMPRRKHRTALSFRYLLYEENPGLVSNYALIFSATNYGTNAGAGAKQLWQKDTKQKWKHLENFVHWMR